MFSWKHPRNVILPLQTAILPTDTPKRATELLMIPLPTILAQLSMKYVGVCLVVVCLYIVVCLHISGEYKRYIFIKYLLVSKISEFAKYKKLKYAKKFIFLRITSSFNLREWIMNILFNFLLHTSLRYKSAAKIIKLF